MAIYLHGPRAHHSSMPAYWFPWDVLAAARVTQQLQALL